MDNNTQDTERVMKPLLLPLLPNYSHITTEYLMAKPRYTMLQNHLS
jgi:hypothetical protein